MNEEFAFDGPYGAIDGIGESSMVPLGKTLGWVGRSASGSFGEAGSFSTGDTVVAVEKCERSGRVPSD